MVARPRSELYLCCHWTVTHLPRHPNPASSHGNARETHAHSASCPATWPHPCRGVVELSGRRELGRRRTLRCSIGSRLPPQPRQRRPIHRHRCRRLGAAPWRECELTAWAACAAVTWLLLVVQQVALWGRARTPYKGTHTCVHQRAMPVSCCSPPPRSQRHYGAGANVREARF